jgi:phenylpropionate dioxygenase-like ring-hydroxylating dioxygenase large terminal subunit
MRAYPVQERAGWVWVHTEGLAEPRTQLDGAPNPAAVDEVDGPPERASDTLPLRLFAELEDPEYRGFPFRLCWHAHFTRVVENSLDVSHLPFVHADTTGDVDPMVWQLRYGAEGQRLWIHPAPFRNAHPMEPPRPARSDAWSPEEQVEIELWFPNLWIIRAPVAGAAAMCTFLTFTPADEETTWTFGMCLRDFAHDAALMDEHHLSHTLHVLEEDQRIVESLRPRRAPFQMQDEVHVPSDGPTLRYRHMLRRALGRGPRGSGDTTSR